MVTGKKNITQLNHEWVSYGIYEFAETSEQIYGSGEDIIDDGTYFMHYGENKTAEKGKYLNIWNTSSLK